MKRLSLFIIVILFVNISYAAKYKLELNLKKGETYIQNMSSESSIQQEFGGQKMKIDMNIVGKTSYKVIDITNDIYEMMVKYESLTMKMIMPNKEMEFSSEKNDENDMFSTLLSKIKNKSFSIKMTKTGEISEVKGVDSLFSNIFEGIPNMNAEQKKQMLSQLNQAYGEKAFKGNLEMATSIYPKDQVSKGDKWTKDSQMEAAMSISMSTNYELIEVADSEYLIAGVSILETVDKEAYIQTNGMPLKYEMSGTMNSDIKINKKTGWIKNAVITQTIQGNAYIKKNDKIPDGMTIPMSITTKMNITE